MGRQFLIEEYATSRMTVVSTMATVYLSYLRRLTFPIALSPLADVPFQRLPSPLAILGLAALAATFVALAVAARRRTRLGETGRAGLFGGLWFFVAMAPFSNLVPFRHLLADRYVYFASAGFCLIVAALLGRLRPRAGGALLATILLPWAALSMRQAHLWGDPLALYDDALRRDPENHFLHLFRGEYLASIEHPAAEEALRRATGLPPRSTPFDLSQAWIDLGNVLLGRGALREAQECYARALAIAPDSARAWGGLANARKAAGDVAGAILPFTRAYVLAPEDPSYPLAVGSCLLELGRDAEAAPWFERTLAVDPDRSTAREFLAEIARRSGNLLAAAAHLDAALEGHPDEPALHVARAGIAIEAGETDVARGHLAQARTLLGVRPDQATRREMEELERKLGR